MRVAHIDTERTWRGGEQQLFSLVQALKKRGHEDWVVLRSNSALHERLKDQNISIMESNPLGEWDLAAAWFLNGKLKKEKIDVVHAHTGHGVALAVTATLGTKIPVVAARRVDFHLRDNFFSRWKYQRVAKICAVSEKIRQILIQDGVPEEKISVIYDGIDPDRYTDVQALTREELGISKENIVIGQIAALEGHKDQSTFLDSIVQLYSQYPEIRVFILGEGRLRKLLEARTETLGLNGIVKFLGFKNEPLRYLAAFDVFCLSSCEEGLGTSILDAMALKIPVVATAAGGIPEVVENGVTGYLAEVRNPYSLAQALAKAIREKSRNNALLQSARDKSNQFNISFTTSYTEALYKSLLNGHSKNIEG
jgi:glycosyltransferase involved in cell wall biosynthesis